MNDIARRRVLMLAPLALAGAGGVAFLSMLNGMKKGTFDPHAIDNPLVGKPVPDFDLPGTGSRPGFSSTALRQAAATGPVLVNFFASWCIPCASEADLVGTLSQQGLPIWGIAYKDAPDKTAKFLDEYGNPYSRIANDLGGRVTIDWGVDGVPESFLIDRTGIVRWHLGGPFNENNVRDQLEPALKAIS